VDVKVQDLFNMEFNHAVCLAYDSARHTGLLKAIEHLGDDVGFNDCQFLVWF